MLCSNCEDIHHIEVPRGEYPPDVIERFMNHHSKWSYGKPWKPLDPKESASLEIPIELSSNTCDDSKDKIKDTDCFMFCFNCEQYFYLTWKLVRNKRNRKQIESSVCSPCLNEGVSGVNVEETDEHERLLSIEKWLMNE